MTIFRSRIEKQVYSSLPHIAHPFLKDLFRNKMYLNRKLFNFTINRFENRLKRNYLISYPYYLVLDPANICNLTCPLCPTWQDSQGRPKGKMDMTMFKKIFDETGPYLFAVNLCNWGEPFLNPELPEMIEYAKKFNTVVGLSTNLNYLPDDTAKKISGSGIDIIVISLDGASQETYSKYRRGGNLEKVLGNIEKLISCKKPGMKFPDLYWQFLVNRYNESEIETAKQMAEKMGLKFHASPMRTSMGKELLLPLYERISELSDWLPENPSYNRYNYEIGPETKTRQKTCKWLWNSAVINCDGSISPCCGVYEKRWDLTACYAASKEKPLTFHQAWNSPRYRLARELVSAHMKGSKNLASTLHHAAREELICTKCTRYGFLED
jgi:MoaA/NifB/PqqE/SkfB family radical SAM enzyme